MAIPAQLDGRLALPVVAAPMYIVSGRALVTAQCRAGVLGAFPSLNARPESELAAWIDRIREDLAAHDAANPGRPAAPFAVNLIASASNARFEHDARVCFDKQVPVVITSLRAPGDVVAEVHAYGGLVFHDVTTLRHAEKAAGQGVDGLVLVCAGAGGHAGTLSPFALLPEVRRIFSGTIILAGAITGGRQLVAARALGADLAYIGTRFIAATEADADPRYKEMILRSAASDIVYTPYFSGIPANYLAASIVAAGLDPDEIRQARSAETGYTPGRRQSVKAWRDVWSAGQGVGSIDRTATVADIVDELAAEYDVALGALCGVNGPEKGG